MENKDLKIAFLGGPQISVDFFNHVYELGISPSLVVTTPDKPAGRKMKLTSPILKVWADSKDIPVIQPELLKCDAVGDILHDFDLFIVVAYGKIIPKKILYLAKHGAINFHPSLLPKYRGASPIVSALLADDKKTGMSLMLLDKEMDHGPLLIQKEFLIKEWKKNRILESEFATAGASLLVDVISDYLSGELEPIEQDHDKATYCGKYTKADMQLDLESGRESFLKYCAFEKPFFFHGEKRVIVTDADWINDSFVINRVVPEGKKETDWDTYSNH